MLLAFKWFLLFLASKLCVSFRLHSVSNTNKWRSSVLASSISMGPDAKFLSQDQRKELWKTISNTERKAVDILKSIPGESNEEKTEEAYKLLASTAVMRYKDPFFELARQYESAKEANDEDEMKRVLEAMKKVEIPPHLAALVKEVSLSNSKTSSTDLSSDVLSGEINPDLPEEVDPGSTFSDTVTEKVRVKISSFYDADKSEPSEGKYMFWYKVAIHNESPEPVQVVARMWEIEKCKGEKEVVRGSGIQSQQPIISPGDVFTYQSTCPLKVFPPKGKRILGSMSGAYTMCKGNMGQHNFTAKVSKFNLILPESVVA